MSARARLNTRWRNSALARGELAWHALVRIAPAGAPQRRSDLAPQAAQGCAAHPRYPAAPATNRLAAYL